MPDGVYRSSEYIESDEYPLIGVAKVDNADAIKETIENSTLSAAQRNPNQVWACVAGSVCELSALHVAVDLGNANAVGMLLKLGADPHTQTIDYTSLGEVGGPRSSKSGNISGRSALHFAGDGAFGLKGGRSEADGAETFKKIMDEQHVALQPDGAYQFSDYIELEQFPLIAAAKANDADAIFSIAKNTDLTTEQRDPNHQCPGCVKGRGNQHTPLHIAVDLGRMAAISALLRIGGDPDICAVAIWDGPYDSWRFAREGALGEAGGKSKQDGEDALSSIGQITVQLSISEDRQRWDFLSLSGKAVATLTNDGPLDAYSKDELQRWLKEQLGLPVRVVLPNGQLLRNVDDLQIALRS